MRPIAVETLAARVTVGDTPVALQVRLLELCVALAVHPGIDKWQLAELLYPELDTTVAARRLRVYAFRLRTQVPGLLSAGAGRYALHDGVTVDIDSIERAIRWDADHTSLCHAVFRLAQPRVCAPFDRWSWFAPVEARLADLTSDALVALLKSDIEQRDAERALSVARFVIRFDPCNEHAHRLLIRTFLARRRQFDAMRAYQRYRCALRQELDVEPATDLRALVGATA